MSVVTSPSRRGDRLASILGWTGVVMLTLVSGFFSMFAFGEIATEGFTGFLLHFIQMAFVIGFGLLAAALPKLGSLLLTIPALYTMLNFTLLVIGLLLLLTAVLLFVGRPQPKWLAYWVVAAGPIVLGAATAVGMSFTH